MPTYSTYAQLRTPLGPEANVVPADLALLADGIDPLLNLQATDEADRDARYNNAPVGTLVSLTSVGMLCWKGLDGWQIVSRRAQTITNALAPTSDWSPTYNTLYISVNGMAQLYLSITYQGSGISVPSNGNISNQQVGTIDSQYAPVLSAPLSMTVGGPLTGGACDSSGNVQLTAVAPGSDIPNGYGLQLIGWWAL